MTMKASIFGDVNEEVQAVIEPLARAAAVLRAQGIALTGVTFKTTRAHLHGALFNTPAGSIRIEVEGCEDRNEDD